MPREDKGKGKDPVQRVLFSKTNMPEDKDEVNKGSSFNSNPPSSSYSTEGEMESPTRRLAPRYMQVNNYDMPKPVITSAQASVTGIASPSGKPMGPRSMGMSGQDGSPRHSPISSATTAAPIASGVAVSGTIIPFNARSVQPPAPQEEQIGARRGPHPDYPTPLQGGGRRGMGYYHARAFERPTEHPAGPRSPHQPQGKTFPLYQVRYDKLEAVYKKDENEPTELDSAQVDRLKIYPKIQVPRPQRDERAVAGPSRPQQARQATVEDESEEDLYEPPKTVVPVKRGGNPKPKRGDN